MPRHLSPEQLHEVYSSIGAAVWHFQFLEDVLVTYLTMRLKLKRPITPEKAQAILAAERRKTLGMLITEAKASQLVQGDLAEAVAVLLDERNWLIHRSMHECNDGLYAGFGFEAFLVRVHTLRERAIELKKRLYSDTEAWRGGQGVDLHRVEATAAAQVRRMRGDA